MTAISPAGDDAGQAQGSGHRAARTINSNTFQDSDYMFGSMCNPDPAIRRKAPDHLMDVYNTDVRPLLAGIREEMGLDRNPLDTYRLSGDAERIASERVAGAQAGWGA